MIDKLMLGGYIGFMVGIAASSVGKLTELQHPFPWWLPLMMFAVVSIPAWLGYLIGKEKQ